MVATLIGLVVMVAFFGSAWWLQVWYNKGGKYKTIDFTEALLFIIIAVLALWLVLNIAEEVGKAVLKLF